LNLIHCVDCCGELSLLTPGQDESFRDDDSREIKEGLIKCNSCSQWFPLKNYIPELLPNHLRNRIEDRSFLDSFKDKLPDGLFKTLSDKLNENNQGAAETKDSGAHFKQSEISIKSKIDDPFFFGPGLTLPFNPGDTEYTMRVIRRFGNVLPLLELKKGDWVADIGPAYAWTTEWFEKMGVNVIGVDICRTYMEIGLQRMEQMVQKGLKRPHLVVADVENLPLNDRILNAVLCFDSFHHIPDRKQAMAHFHRTLKETGNIVLAEPDGTHEYAEVSRSVMDKYGILEKGMELSDVKGYCAGLNILPPEQRYILHLSNSEKRRRLSTDFILSHSHIDCNVFVIKKRLTQDTRAFTYTKTKSKIKQRIKRLLKRFFIKVFR